MKEDILYEKEVFINGNSGCNSSSSCSDSYDKSADAATTDVSSAVVTSMTATAAQSGKWIHGGGWWYQYADGTYPKDCFAEINGKTYYFDHSGYMVTGWKEIDYGTYYFDSNGAMVTGWQSIGGKWYYFKEYGRMAIHVTEVNNKQQVFAPSGQWVSGWTYDRKIYYNDDGTVNRDYYNWIMLILTEHHMITTRMTIYRVAGSSMAANGIILILMEKC